MFLFIIWYIISSERKIKMKKVVKVTVDEMELDDGTIIPLVFDNNKVLTLEEAQQVYESSLFLLNKLMEKKNEVTDDKTNI